MRINCKKLYISAFCLYLAAVAALCFLRPDSLPSVDKDTFLGIPIDKLLHFLMFLPYPILSAMAFINNEKSMVSNATTLLILAVTGVGIAYATEIIQLHTGYRSYETADFYADSIGIAAGTLTYAIYLAIIKLKK